MLTSVGTVSEAWRYPIKSVGGVRAGTVDLDQRGVRADRGFAVYGDDGKIGSGKSTRRFRRMDGSSSARSASDRPARS
ncbi:MAG: MOSC domain-containing protein [Dehalococcoidia bacterium]|nr:MOSC domain-containing protein [Dehalococcoidia bacterium]